MTHRAPLSTSRTRAGHRGGAAAAAMLLLVLALAALAVMPARAQDTAATAGPQEVTAIVADVVRIDGNERLVATGNVEVFSRGTRLRAQSVTYDRAADRVQIGGPIELRDADGTIVLADQAELDSELTEGILRGARLVLDGRLQVAGAEMARRQDRFNDLRQVAASSCKVCETGETPLWEIRASRVIHDQDAGQVYFYNARFRIAGVPVFYLPALRVPDGTDPRVRGFLAPSVRNTTELGTGVKLPYFIPLGDHADVTLTPYITENQSRTLEGRFRRAFVNGDILAEGAVSRDTLEPGSNRGYLFVNGSFAIPRDFTFTFNLETTSDKPYLRDYDYSDKDRLDSSVALSRVRSGERIEGALTFYNSLRADRDDDDEPTLVGDARWNRRVQAPGPGGWVDLDLIGHFHQRESTEDIVGRDMAQIRGRAGWRQRWTGPGGLRFSARAELTADLKQITDDSRFESTQAGLWPQGAVTLSWPLIRPSADGGHQLLEPVLQVAHSADTGIDTANDDSTQVALDTGNLFAFNRFPGLDRTETGTRANVALRWSIVDPKGVAIRLTGGRVYRQSGRGQFSQESGLSGAESDWLAQIDLDITDTLNFRTLALLDDDLDLSLYEARLFLRGPFGSLLTSNYIWQAADTAAELNDDVSELAASASVPVTRSWSARGELRRDFTVGRTNYSGLGVAYQNECIRVDLSVARRFRATSDVDATTTYGLSVELAGFGTQGRAATPGRCKN
ncbi:LPS-assembly protein LptD [Meridianimarinicoccus roseus]|uniref:LPS-assembly protein LptD n=2 Tax=Meridianimarinicoccus roseus TaxID=2072018 RepID=A0A2V2LCG7_9RHOB|nr:LPS-assembly protein LptD [Meridianimarinicoccus roseus]